MSKTKISQLPSGQAINTASGTGTIDNMVIGSSSPQAAHVTFLNDMNPDTFLTSVSEVVSVITSTSNAITVNLSTTNVFKHTFTENTTFTFSNPTATGNLCQFSLWLFQGATPYTPTWPGSVKWSNATPPVLNNANKNYLISFSTIDGGTTWIGILAAEAYA